MILDGIPKRKFVVASDDLILLMVGDTPLHIEIKRVFVVGIRIQVSEWGTSEWDLSLPNSGCSHKVADF
jgi:hypothetical protein